MVSWKLSNKSCNVRRATSGLTISSLFSFVADQGSNICGIFLTVVSYILIAVTFPISVFMCIKVSFAKLYFTLG